MGEKKRGNMYVLVSFTVDCSVSLCGVLHRGNCVEGGIFPVHRTSAGDCTGSFEYPALHNDHWYPAGRCAV